MGCAFNPSFEEKICISTFYCLVLGLFGRSDITYGISWLPCGNRVEILDLSLVFAFDIPTERNGKVRYHATFEDLSNASVLSSWVELCCWLDYTTVSLRLLYLLATIPEQ